MRLIARTTIAAGCFLAAIGCQQTAIPSSRAAAVDTVPAWRWSMDTIRTVVNAVRAGRSLIPQSWPGGARVAVYPYGGIQEEDTPLDG